MKLATLCYVRSNDKTLMLHRIKKEDDIHEGKWNGLGGKFEPTETPEDCVIREVFEESGLQIRNPVLKGLLTFPEFKNGEDWYVFVFEATEFSGDLINSPEGYLEWIETFKITQLNLWEGDKYFFEWMAKDSFFSARFTYKNKKLTDYSVTHY